MTLTWSDLLFLKHGEILENSETDCACRFVLRIDVAPDLDGTA
jgi:hypothetical protein